MTAPTEHRTEVASALTAGPSNLLSEGLLRPLDTAQTLKSRSKVEHRELRGWQVEVLHGLTSDSTGTEKSGV